MGSARTLKRRRTRQRQKARPKRTGNKFITAEMLTSMDAYLAEVFALSQRVDREYGCMAQGAKVGETITIRLPQRLTLKPDRD